MWRVDDPIGNRVDLFGGNVVRNIPLRPGGHVDYWKDPEVIRAILDLIDERPVSAEHLSAIGDEQQVFAEPAPASA